MVHIIVRRRPEQIPDPAYRQEAAKKALQESGWDGARAMEHLRKRVTEDKEGRKVVNLADSP